jgi:exosortase
MLNALNVPVFQHSNYLDLPTISLEVARACSGVNYLVSIIALGIPLAYFTQKTWLRKIVLVLSGVIVGIIINSIRVTLIGIWAYRGGEIVHGPLHIFQSFFVSVIGFIFLIIFAVILNKIPYTTRCTNANISKMSC